MMTMKMPKKWKKLYSECHDNGNSPIILKQLYNQKMSLLLLKEMAEALEYYATVTNGGNFHLVSAEIAQESLNRFKEWK